MDREEEASQADRLVRGASAGSLNAWALRGGGLANASLELDPLGDLHNVLPREGAAGIKVVAARALHPSDELAHVGGEAVLGGLPGHAGGPATEAHSAIRILIAAASTEYKEANPKYPVLERAYEDL